MTPSINGNGDYHKIVGAMMASSKSFFSSSDFSEVTGVHMRDANRIIAELESRGILELWTRDEVPDSKNLKWELKKDVANKYLEGKKNDVTTSTGKSA